MIAMLDPIDRVQPRSRTTCVGWWARFKGTDAIHAVCLVQDHQEAEVVESSAKTFIVENTLPILFWSLPLPLCGFKSLPAPFPGWLVRKPLSERWFFYLSKNLSCLFLLWTTKPNLLVTTIQGAVLVLHQGMLFPFF